MPVDAVSAVDVGYPQRFFYLLGDTSTGFRLATFHAVFGKTDYTPFGDGAFVVRGSFHYAAGAGGDGVGGVVALVGGEGVGTDIELASWSASGTRTVRCVASRPPRGHDQERQTLNGRGRFLFLLASPRGHTHTQRSDRHRLGRHPPTIERRFGRPTTCQRPTAVTLM